VRRKFTAIECLVVAAILAIVVVIVTTEFNRTRNVLRAGDRVVVDNQDGVVLGRATDMPRDWLRVRLRLEGANGTTYTEASFHASELERRE
jgi:hypothetical protein